MDRKSLKAVAIYVGLVVVSLSVGMPSVRAQNGSEGTVTVTVLDPSGSEVVTDAHSGTAAIHLRTTHAMEIRRIRARIPSSISPWEPIS